jgi:1-acyl-sn-glycerol-3-phosphate acyltransferase
MVYITNTVFRQFYQGVHVHQGDFQRLQGIAKKAFERKVPLIFLPCHKSHLDYMVLSFAFYRLGISLPHIAAGENLNIPMVGNLLRNCGAFFIRRTFAHDKLYTTVVQEYVTLLLRHGYNLEFFPEGTRSRTGKLMSPKMGMMIMVLNAILSGEVKDAYIVPISIVYDKVF